MAQLTIQASADVHAHLASVAHQARMAVLRGPLGHPIQGLLAPPDDEGRIAFRGASPTEAAALTQGVQVKVEYRQAPGNCAFDSRVVARGVAGNFILAVPATRKTSTLLALESCRVGRVLLFSWNNY